MEQGSLSELTSWPSTGLNYLASLETGRREILATLQYMSFVLRLDLEHEV